MVAPLGGGDKLHRPAPFFEQTRMCLIILRKP